jgi:hypothetical protein
MPRHNLLDSITVEMRQIATGMPTAQSR